MGGHVFIATSLDGFIAREDGDIRWLVERDDPSEDHGYHDFKRGMDAILMGRGTFDTVVGFDPWPYTVPVFVLSRSLDPRALPERLRDNVRVLACAPAEAMARLREEGLRNVYVDGGQVIRSFLREALVEDLVITTVPVLLGSGRRLFGALDRDVDLELVGVRSFPSGLVQSTYRVRGAGA